MHAEHSVCEQEIMWCHLLSVSALVALRLYALKLSGIVPKRA